MHKTKLLFFWSQAPKRSWACISRGMLWPTVPGTLRKFSVHISQSNSKVLRCQLTRPILFHAIFQTSFLPSWLIIKLLLKYYHQFTPSDTLLCIFLTKPVTITSLKLIQWHMLCLDFFRKFIYPLLTALNLTSSNQAHVPVWLKNGLHFLPFSKPSIIHQATRVLCLPLWHWQRLH